MKIRATILLLAAFALAACGAKVPYEPLTPAQLAEMEAANAAVVNAAASSCGYNSNKVFPYGAQGWEIDSNFAESLNESEIRDIERCMAVALAAADRNLLDHITLSPNGDYVFLAEFVTANEASMSQIDRGLQEAIQHRLEEMGH